MKVHVIPVGLFGAQVAEALAERVNVEVSGELEIGIPALWPQSDIQVVASWREDPPMFELADIMAHNLGRPWLSVSLDAKSLRVGPVIVPRESGCYRCFVRRQYQHGKLSASDREILDLYSRDRSQGIFGHLPSHVALATAIIENYIDLIDAGEFDRRSGALTRVGMTMLGMTTGTLIGVDGCDRCGHRDPDSTWRLFSNRLIEGVPL